MNKYEPEGIFPAQAYAVVEDVARPQTWKVRLWDVVTRTISVAQLRIVEDDLAAYDVPGLLLTDRELVAAHKRLMAEMDRLKIVPANHR